MIIKINKELGMTTAHEILIEKYDFEHEFKWVEELEKNIDVYSKKGKSYIFKNIDHDNGYVYQIELEKL